MWLHIYIGINIYVYIIWQKYSLTYRKKKLYRTRADQKHSKLLIIIIISKRYNLHNKYKLVLY